MTAYCADADLLLGGIPIPTGISASKIISDAADEIDSKIGFIYTTPIDVDGSAVPRPVKLLLKRINASLASGRLILAALGGNEDSQLNAYGWSLVKEASSAIDSIASGQIVLEGVPQLPGGAPEITGPLLSNLDAESNVEAFYDRIANPALLNPLDAARWPLRPPITL